MSNSLKNEQGTEEIGDLHQDLVSNGNEEEDAETAPRARLMENSIEDEENGDELRREEPLDSTFDKNRSFDAKAKGSVDEGAESQQHRRRPLLDHGGSFSISSSNAGEDEDLPSKNVMEEKRIAGEDNAEATG